MSGAKGEPGRPGDVGPVGQKGDSIAKSNYSGLPNWKQCTWTTGDQRGFGLIRVSKYLVKSLVIIYFASGQGNEDSLRSGSYRAKEAVWQV